MHGTLEDRILRNAEGKLEQEMRTLLGTDSTFEKVTDKTAGIILEIIQCEGGVNIGTIEFFEQVRKFCTEKNLLLIIDEVQTGFCRTGKMFACNQFNLRPDMICLAKAISFFRLLPRSRSSGMSKYSQTAR